MDKQRRGEIARFMGSGIVATTTDYLILNGLAILLHVPPVLANTASGAVSSFVSYKVNKHVVFEDRMHGRVKTLILYAVIIGSGIVVIQNGLIHLISGNIALAIAKFIEPALYLVHLNNLSETFVSLNIAKVIASLVAALWNYFMLRRFVFITADEVADDTKGTSSSS
ncbi:MAG TPA: GtrA family protein [Candidatus Saccharimonadales bacterium]|jgi:putative flippase GtrA